MPDGDDLDLEAVDPVSVSKITKGTVVVGEAEEEAEVFDELGRLERRLKSPGKSEHPNVLVFLIVGASGGIVAYLPLVPYLIDSYLVDLSTYGIYFPESIFSSQSVILLYVVYFALVVAVTVSVATVTAEVVDEFLHKKKLTGYPVETQRVLEYIEASPLRLLQNDVNSERADVLLELLDEIDDHIIELYSRFGNEVDIIEFRPDIESKLAHVASELGTVLLDGGEYRMALDAYSVADRAIEVLDESDSDDLPDNEQNVVDCHVGIMNEYVRAGQRAMDDGDYESAIEEYETAVQYRPAHDIEDELVANLRNRAWRGRAEAHLQIANERIEEATAHLEEEEFEAAANGYQSAIDYLEENDHVVDDEAASEQREKLKDLRDRARSGQLEVDIQIGAQKLEAATTSLEAGEYEAAERRFRRAVEYIEDADPGRGSGGEDVQYRRDRLKALEERARRGPIHIGKQQLEDATADFEDGEYDSARRRFHSAIEHFEDIDTSATDLDEEGIQDAIKTAREGIAKANIEQQRDALAAATARFEDGAYREARDRFTEIRERLEELRSYAEDHELTDETETVDSLIEECEAGIGSARRALADVDGAEFDLEPDVSIDEPLEVATTEDVPGMGDIDEFDVDIDIPSVTDGISRPSGVLVEPDLLTELPDRDEMELVGRGGNAQVYKLTPQDGNEPVAIKVPLWRGDETLDRAAMEDFVEEALIWNKIDDDENIVEVQHVGTEPYPWIQMEYMDAGTLADRVGEVGLEEAVRLLTVLCETIGEVHQNRGVQHADLKPSNILFRTGADGEEEVKVADWGTARVLFEHSKSMDEFTPSYAAPEQVNSERFGDVDSRTDIYQMGVVAYELLTGQVPFDYEETGAILDAIKSEELPPASSLADLSPEVDGVLLEALAKEKGERYESLRYFRDGLQGLVE